MGMFLSKIMLQGECGTVIVIYLILYICNYLASYFPGINLYCYSYFDMLNQLLIQHSI